MGQVQCSDSAEDLVPDYKKKNIMNRNNGNYPAHNWDDNQGGGYRNNGAAGDNQHRKGYGQNPNSQDGGDNFGAQNRPSNNIQNHGQYGQHHINSHHGPPRRKYRDLGETQDLKRVSRLGSEFGIKNSGRNNNCFLNAALQAIWVFPYVRFVMQQQFTQQTQGYPVELKSLISALQTFYMQSHIQQEQAKQNGDSTIQVFDARSIRRELFKLKYFGGAFELNREADSYEALDTILTSIHTWGLMSELPREIPRSNPGADYNLSKAAEAIHSSCQCFVHSIFHMDLKKRLACNSCNQGGKKLGETSPNLFAESINMTTLLKGLEVMKNESHYQSSRGIKGKFFECLHEDTKDIQQRKCIDENGAIVNHSHHAVHNLSEMGNSPEVLTFNLNWQNARPKAHELFDAMLALPEILDLNHLYRTMTHDRYAFRGMICYGHNHYFAIFRRILFKLDFMGLDPSQYTNIEREMREQEVCEESEWVVFDDDSLRTFPGNWAGVIQNMLEQQSFPTVIFYEKLLDRDDYQKSQGFSSATEDDQVYAELSQSVQQLAQAQQQFLGNDAMMSEEEQMRLIIEASMKEQAMPEPPRKPRTVIEMVPGENYAVRWTTGADQDIHAKSFKSSGEAMTQLTNVEQNKGSAIFYLFGKATKSVGVKEILKQLRLAKLDQASRSEPSASHQQAPEEEKKAPAVPLSKEATLALIKKRFYQNGVFIHLCGGCNKVGQMLHHEICLLCQHPNEYFDESAQIDQFVDAQVKTLLVKVDRGMQIDTDCLQEPKLKPPSDVIRSQEHDQSLATPGEPRFSAAAPQAIQNKDTPNKPEINNFAQSKRGQNDADEEHKEVIQFQYQTFAQSEILAGKLSDFHISDQPRETWKSPLPECLPGDDDSEIPQQQPENSLTRNQSQPQPSSNSQLGHEMPIRETYGENPVRVTRKPTQTSETMPYANITTAVDPVPTQDYGDNTHWKCWICTTLYPISIKCIKCNVQLEQYLTGDLNEILERVYTSQEQEVPAVIAPDAVSLAKPNQQEEKQDSTDLFRDPEQEQAVQVDTTIVEIGPKIPITESVFSQHSLPGQAQMRPQTRIDSVRCTVVEGAEDEDADNLMEGLGYNANIGPQNSTPGHQNIIDPQLDRQENILQDIEDENRKAKEAHAYTQAQAEQQRQNLIREKQLSQAKIGEDRYQAELKRQHLIKQEEERKANETMLQAIVEEDGKRRAQELKDHKLAKEFEGKEKANERRQEEMRFKQEASEIAKKEKKDREHEKILEYTRQKIERQRQKEEHEREREHQRMLEQARQQIIERQRQEEREEREAKKAAICKADEDRKRAKEDEKMYRKAQEHRDKQFAEQLAEEESLRLQREEFELAMKQRQEQARRDHQVAQHLQNAPQIAQEGALNEQVDSPRSDRSPVGQGMAAQEEQKSEPLSDANNFKCEQCAFVNTVWDWANPANGNCKSCGQEDEGTVTAIVELIREIQSEHQHEINQQQPEEEKCLRCSSEINPETNRCEWCYQREQKARNECKVCGTHIHDTKNGCQNCLMDQRWRDLQAQPIGYANKSCWKCQRVFQNPMPGRTVCTDCQKMCVRCKRTQVQSKTSSWCTTCTLEVKRSYKSQQVETRSRCAQNNPQRCKGNTCRYRCVSCGQKDGFHTRYGQQALCSKCNAMSYNRHMRQCEICRLEYPKI